MVREKRNIFFQGQGKVRKFWIKSGKFLISATVSVYTEEGGWVDIIYMGGLYTVLKNNNIHIVNFSMSIIMAGKVVTGNFKA